MSKRGLDLFLLVVTLQMLYIHEIDAREYTDKTKWKEGYDKCASLILQQFWSRSFFNQWLLEFFAEPSSYHWFVLNSHVLLVRLFCCNPRQSSSIRRPFLRIRLHIRWLRVIIQRKTNHHVAIYTDLQATVAHILHFKWCNIILLSLRHIFYPKDW